VTVHIDASVHGHACRPICTVVHVNIYVLYIAIYIARLTV